MGCKNLPLIVVTIYLATTCGLHSTVTSSMASLMEQTRYTKSSRFNHLLGSMTKACTRPVCMKLRGGNEPPEGPDHQGKEDEVSHLMDLSGDGGVRKYMKTPGYLSPIIAVGDEVSIGVVRRHRKPRIFP
jgi:hypothetical protein